MNHKAILDECAALGLRVEQTQTDATGARHFNALGQAILPRVYWRTSTECGVLGLPRVITAQGHDTHVRTIKELRYLVKG